MQVIVLADEAQKAALGTDPLPGVTWIENETAFLQHGEADAFLDLLYENTPERNLSLAQLLPKPVIINSVIETLQETNRSFVRINGWASFLSSPVLEASSNDERAKTLTEEVFFLFGRKVEWLPDDAGLVTARVVSMIINEAYLALAEGVSTKEEINTAMKLGTAYPFGPLEWAEIIGVKNIVALLQKLHSAQLRYEPAPLLIKEAFA